MHGRGRPAQCFATPGGGDKEGGRETQEGGDMGIYVCIYLIHFVIQQKLTQHCKAIIL